ncbi:MAG: hypothetical protein ACOCVN_02910 [bacterium]
MIQGKSCYGTGTHFSLKSGGEFVIFPVVFLVTVMNNESSKDKLISS